MTFRILDALDALAFRMEQFAYELLETAKRIDSVRDRLTDRWEDR
jgi:hypothetical protein